MPQSVPNLTGSNDAADTPFGYYRSFPSQPYPEYGGERSVIYRSADGQVVAGVARESGTATLTYPCDEFFFVTEGWCDVVMHGGAGDNQPSRFRLAKGDCIYITKGTTADFVFGPDFWNVAVFVDKEKVTQF